MVLDIEIRFTPYDRAMFLVTSLDVKFHSPEFEVHPEQMC